MKFLSRFVGFVRFSGPRLTERGKQKGVRVGKIGRTKARVLHSAKEVMGRTGDFDEFEVPRSRAHGLGEPPALFDDGLTIGEPDRDIKINAEALVDVVDR